MKVLKMILFVAIFFILFASVMGYRQQLQTDRELRDAMQTIDQLYSAYDNATQTIKQLTLERELWESIAKGNITITIDQVPIGPPD